MISQSDINTALAAANNPVMIESAKQLERWANTWKDLELISIDTEFVRERTWRAELGLVQVSDGEAVWLVDPLKTGTLEPLAAILELPSLIKVIHAPSEDLDVLLHATGVVPEPLYDTQTACALLGQPLQMGYHNTAEWLFGVAVDKGETRSNWCKRPLRPAQLHYASLDVCLLPLMCLELNAQLEDLGRREWLEEECARQVSRAQIPVDSGQAWQRINGNGRLDGTSLAVLKLMATWRDQQAEKRNLARGFFIRDSALLSIAKAKPEDIGSLSVLDVLHPRALERHGRFILGTIANVRQQGLTVEPLKTLKPSQRKLMAGMKAMVRAKSEALSIEPALLASKRDLEGLILTAPGEPLPERLTGWRKTVITDELLALME